LQYIITRPIVAIKKLINLLTATSIQSNNNKQQSNSMALSQLKQEIDDQYDALNKSNNFPSVLSDPYLIKMYVYMALLKNDLPVEYKNINPIVDVSNGTFEWTFKKDFIVFTVTATVQSGNKLMLTTKFIGDGMFTTHNVFHKSNAFMSIFFDSEKQEEYKWLSVFMSFNMFTKKFLE
jgi:hypothetical protein